MSEVKAEVVAKRGRPEQYGAGYVRAFKSVVRKHGLLKGREVLNAQGIVVGGKKKEVSISLPTLAKYVKREDVGGAAVALKRGRPATKKVA